MVTTTQNRPMWNGLSDGLTVPPQWFQSIEQAGRADLPSILILAYIVRLCRPYLAQATPQTLRLNVPNHDGLEIDKESLGLFFGFGALSVTLAIYRLAARGLIEIVQDHGATIVVLPVQHAIAQYTEVV